MRQPRSLRTIFSDTRTALWCTMLFLRMPSHWLQTYPYSLLEEWRSVLQSLLTLCSCTWTAYKNDGYLFLVKLVEEVAKLHFPAFDTELNVLTQEQIIQVSKLKATSVSMAAYGCPVCVKRQTLYQRDRPGWLRRLGKLMLCSFTNRTTRPTKTIFNSCR